METKELKAVISSKFRKNMLIAFFAYELAIFVISVLCLIVGAIDVINDRGGDLSWFFVQIHPGYSDSSRGESFAPLIFVTLILMVPPIIALIINVRRRNLTEFTANERGIVGSYTGFIPISKITIKIPIEKIDNIAAVNRVIYWFTGKTVRIGSASSVIKIPFVDNADEVVAFISEAIEKAKNRSLQVTAVAQPERPPVDIADSLKKFAELRDAGIITEEEFNQKKSELLGECRKL